MGKTPIAVFTYNRPEHTERTLYYLSRCERLDECQVQIYCDGPKQDAHADTVQASRQIVRAWAKRLNARVVEREENLGLAKSIVGGVTELCEANGKVIVLEDDLVVNPGFLDYMLQGLEKYQEDKSVYQISGFMFPIKYTGETDSFFLPMITTWGWGTWDRAWKSFGWDVPDANNLLSNSEKREKFNIDNSYPYSMMLEDRLATRNDSWGILWWYAVFKAGGLTLYPKRSLVWNGGFDGSGIHCSIPRPNFQLEFNTFLNTEERFAVIIFPNLISVNQAVYEQVKIFLRERYMKKVPLRARIKGFVKRRIFPSL